MLPEVHSPICRVVRLVKGNMDGLACYQAVCAHLIDARLQGLQADLPGGLLLLPVVLGACGARGKACAICLVRAFARGAKAASAEMELLAEVAIEVDSELEAARGDVVGRLREVEFVPVRKAAAVVAEEAGPVLAVEVTGVVLARAAPLIDGEVEGMVEEIGGASPELSLSTDGDKRLRLLGRGNLWVC